jgi:excisionase family DNA binding protein
MLTVVEAAERFGTSPRFVRRLITERRIAFSKIGRHVRLSAIDVDAFIRAGRVEPWTQPVIHRSE